MAVSFDGDATSTAGSTRGMAGLRCVVVDEKHCTCKCCGHKSTDANPFLKDDEGEEDDPEFGGLWPWERYKKAIIDEDGNPVEVKTASKNMCRLCPKAFRLLPLKDQHGDLDKYLEAIHGQAE